MPHPLQRHAVAPLGQRRVCAAAGRGGPGGGGRRRGVPGQGHTTGGRCSCCRWAVQRLLQAGHLVAGRQCSASLATGSGCMVVSHRWCSAQVAGNTCLGCSCLPMLLPLLLLLQVLDDSEGPTTKREYQQMMVPGQHAPPVTATAAARSLLLLLLLAAAVADIPLYRTCTALWHLALRPPHCCPPPLGLSTCSWRGAGGAGCGLSGPPLPPAAARGRT